MFGSQPMGARELWRLIEWLPMDSPLHRAVDPKGTGAGWDLTTHMLALIAEVVDVGNAMYVRAHSKPGTRTQDPLRIPRPGREVEEPVALTGEALDMAAMALGGAVVVNKKTKRAARKPRPPRDPKWFPTKKPDTAEADKE